MIDEILAVLPNRKYVENLLLAYRMPYTKVKNKNVLLRNILSIQISYYIFEIASQNPIKGYYITVLRDFIIFRPLSILVEPRG